ncbi:MAG: DsbA family protein [Chloroflexota bacterium]
MTLEEKSFPPAKPGAQEGDKLGSLPNEMEPPAPLADSPDETFNEPETPPPPAGNSGEAASDEPETLPPTFGNRTEVPAAHRLTTPPPHNWRYFIAGMGLAIVAMLLGAVLGYLARPALESASFGIAAAPQSPGGPASAAASSAAAPPAARSAANLIAEVVQTGGHSPGSPDAPVVIVEYSDFQCPYCGRHFREVESRLKESYVKNGQVRLVYKHYAFLGQESVWAALASECAAEQNKFWEYHNLIFSRQSGENQGAFSQDNLKAWAAELKLDPTAFNQCLDSNKYLEVVQANTLEGRQLGIRGTPGFYVNDIPIVGAESFEVFQQVIEEKLKTSGQAN